MADCLACQLANGDLNLPGGLIHGTPYWRVEHCVGPLGLGTLIVKSVRHVTSVGALLDDEAIELGPLLRQTSMIVSQLVKADQVYNCLWSHAGGEPVHIHYVIQPVTKVQMSIVGAHGPQLQTAMFAAGDSPNSEDVDRVATAARKRFSEYP
jgi:diadenosine tetraphosphate (Ap4A) HIT family hydrolase